MDLTFLNASNSHHYRIVFTELAIKKNINLLPHVIDMICSMTQVPVHYSVNIFVNYKEFAMMYCAKNASYFTKQTECEYCKDRLCDNCNSYHNYNKSFYCKKCRDCHTEDHRIFKYCFECTTCNNEDHNDEKFMFCNNCEECHDNTKVAICEDCENCITDNICTDCEQINLRFINK